MQQWAVAYTLTCLIEIPVVVALLGWLGWRSRRFPGALLAWLLQCTHPLLWWLLAPADLAQLLLAELVVTAVEGGAVLWWAVVRAGAAPGLRTTERALSIAVVANGLSLLAGLWLSVLGILPLG